jgi:hypothetical protein
MYKSWHGQKRTMCSPKHPDQLQHPPSLQLNENQSFISGSKWAQQSLTTHTCLEQSLKYSGAAPPINLDIVEQLHFTSTSYVRTYLSRGHILSGIIQEPVNTLLTSYMHTT